MRLSSALKKLHYLLQELFSAPNIRNLESSLTGRIPDHSLVSHKSIAPNNTVCNRFIFSAELGLAAGATSQVPEPPSWLFGHMHW